MVQINYPDPMVYSIDNTNIKRYGQFDTPRFEVSVFKFEFGIGAYP